jgi:hypothetical protein
MDGRPVSVLEGGAPGVLEFAAFAFSGGLSPAGNHAVGDYDTSEGTEVRDGAATKYFAVRDGPGLVVAGFLDTMDCDRGAGQQGAQACAGREP